MPASTDSSNAKEPGREELRPDEPAKPDASDPAREARVVLDALERSGFAYQTLEAVRSLARLPAQLTEALLEVLPEIHHPGVVDMVVRLIGQSRTDFDPHRLCELFDSTDSPSIRWAIANTLAEARPPRAAEWIRQRVNDTSLGTDREMLGLAVARTSPPSIANPLLLTMLTELPGHAALGLAESGTIAEVAVLEAVAAKLEGWQQQGVLLAIQKIKKRAREQDLR